MPITFITGPVRSGKSSMAVRIARKSGLPVTFIATAQRDPSDPEWNARIDRHVHDRPAEWSTFESANVATDALNDRLRNADASECLLIDAIGTWLGVRIGDCGDRLPGDYAAVESHLDAEATAFAGALIASPAEVIVVGEQIGWDVVPVLPSVRLFRDVLGRLSQRLARKAKVAYLVVAGHKIELNSPIDED